MAEVYTLKEMVSELRKENKLALEKQAVILERIEHIANKQLEIAEQNKVRNGRLEKLETRMAYLWGGIALLSALGISNLITWAGI